MKRYLFTMAVMAVFAIGFTASDEEQNSSNSSSSNQTEKEESNPYERFVGKYVLYDDEGRNSFYHFKVDIKGNLLQSIGITDEYNNFGRIDIVSDDAFCISLYGNDKIYIKHDDENWPWTNNATRHTYLGPNKTIRFDIKDNRLYPDNKEYEDREYKKPTYYKFRFTKQ